MQQIWEGRYFNGRTAAPQSVTITVLPTGLHLDFSQGPARLIPFEQFRQQQGHYRGEHVYLEFSSNPVESLVVKDSAILHAIHHYAPHMADHIHNPTHRSRRPFIVGGLLLATAALLFVFYRWVIPWSAAYVAHEVPIDWETSLGETIRSSIVGDQNICADAELNRAVRQMVRRLNAAAPTHPYTFDVQVVTSLTLNAFAAPGGKIVLLSGLLDAAETPEMVAGVLAHEMAHVIQRHTTQQLFAQVSTAMLFGALFGNSSQTMDTVMEGARMAGAMHYSRQHEADADRMATELLTRAKINPTGLADFFAAVEKQYGETPKFLHYFASHPQTASRKAAVQLSIGSRTYRPIRFVSGFSWPQLAKRCASVSKD